MFSFYLIIGMIYLQFEGVSNNPFMDGHVYVYKKDLKSWQLWATTMVFTLSEKYESIEIEKLPLTGILLFNEG